MSFLSRLHLTLRSKLCLALTAGTLILLGSAAPAFAYPDVTIYLTNAPSYCLNREGGGNSSGTTVFLYACSGGNNHWYEVPAVNNDWLACMADGCVSFEDYWNTSECLGVNNNYYATLGSCNAEAQVWIDGPTTELHNAAWGYMLVTPNDTNRSPVLLNQTAIDWHQWSGW